MSLTLIMVLAIGLMIVVFTFMVWNSLKIPTTLSLCVAGEYSKPLINIDGLTSLQIPLSSVTLKPEDSSPVVYPIEGGSRTIDLLHRHTLKYLLFDQEIKPGKYSWIRLDVRDPIAIIDGKEVLVEISSAILSFNIPFIIGTQSNDFIIDFQITQNLKKRDDGSYIFHPQLRLIDLETGKDVKTEN